MDGPELLQLLLDKRKLTPNALADLLRQRSLQSQMQRYLARETKSPRPSTLEPIAKFFGIGIEAFYQPAIAQRIAASLAGDETASAHVGEKPSAYGDAVTPAPTPLKPRDSEGVAELIAKLGRALEPYDESARRAVATLLSDVALHPESASVTGQRVAALLGVPGNGSLARFTSSG